jgi:membrane fusion protein, multidrug efflux system
MAPQAALGSSQMGKFVYVVGADDKAELRLLTLGPADGELVSVANGLKEGDRIIVGNLQKIDPGAPVRPMPAQPQPKP